MVHYLIRPALGLSGLLMLPILLLHLQIYDNNALRALLHAPEDCVAPCFMAIQPGVTSEAEALQLLANHRWVGQMTNQRPASYEEANIPMNLVPSWYWSAALPPGIDVASQGVLGIRDEGVEYFEIGTEFRYGELRLLLGEPDRAQHLSWVYNQAQVFKYSAWFAKAQVEVIITDRCPMHRLMFYPIVIRLRQDAPDLRQDAAPGLCA